MAIPCTVSQLLALPFEIFVVVEIVSLGELGILYRHDFLTRVLNRFGTRHVCTGAYDLTVTL